MTELTRWNNWGLSRNRSIFNEFEQMMDDMMRLTGRQVDRPAAWGLAVDVAETEDDFIVQASLPGVEPDNIEVTLEDNLLSIKGELKEEASVEGQSYHIRERRVGQFGRSISLPTKVDSEKVDASFKDGVLTLHVPKAEEVKPKRIAINGASETKTIEANTG